MNKRPRSILLAMFGIGVLSGTAATLISMEFLVPDDNDVPGRKSENEAAQKKKKAKGSKSSGSSSLTGLSPEMALNELGRAVGKIVTDEDFSNVKALVARAVERSPGSTLEKAMLIENPYHRRDVLKRVFSYWIMKDRDGALAALEEIDNVALRSDLHQEAMRRFASDDPTGMIEFLQEKPGAQNQELWGRAFESWARRDREEAVENLLAIKDADLRDHALRSVSRRLANTNLDKALEWVETLNGDSSRTALSGILSEAVASRPSLVSNYLERVPEGRARDEIVRRAAGEWAERDPTAALAWAGNLEGRERERALQEVAESVLETDADRAQEILELIPGSSGREEVMGQIARLRASVDMESSIGWIASLSPEDRDAAWSGVSAQWARTDPEGAAQYALMTGDAEARQRLVSAVSSSWSRSNPEEAAAWAGRLEGRVQSGAMNRIVETWAYNDPEAAGNFVASSLEGDLQVSMTRQVVSRWLRNDSMEASAWIDRLPDGRARDSAVYTLVRSIESDSPEAALQWANTIADSNTRASTVRRIERSLTRR